MSQLTTVPPTTSGRYRRARTAARWMVTFLGFPLGGFASLLLLGAIDSPGKAVVGGVVTGLAIGGAQTMGMGRGGPPAVRWIAATAVGMTAGLVVGATAVDYATTFGALVVQGAISGGAVGIAQAFVLRSRLGRLALAWPPALAAIWAVGWMVTISADIQTEKQFTVFGASGALVVTVLTAVLPLIINHPERSAS